MRAAIVLFVYAALLLIGGVYAFMSAPPDADAKTALIIPGACAAIIVILGFIIAAMRRGKGARIAHIIALVLMLIFAAAFSQRAMAAGEDVQAYLNAAEQYEAGVQAGTLEDTAAARDAFFAAQEAPEHDKSYLANTLWALTIVSALAFVVGIVTRPRPAGESMVREPGEPSPPPA